MPMPAVTAVVAPVGGFNLPHYDSVIVVASSFIGEGLPFQSEFVPVSKIDNSFGKEVHLLVTPKASGSRLITSPTGSLQEDTDDVRKIAEATKKGVLRAKAAGSVRPLLILGKFSTDDQEFALSTQVAILGAYDALYERLQARESLGEKETENVEEIALLVSENQLEDTKNIISVVSAIEEGRRLARDIGGPDAERMTNIRAAAFIQQAFVAHSDCVTVTVVEDDATLRKEYPLLHAVARASLSVPRHKPVVVRLEYKPKEEAEETLLIAGKGVSYDSGGVDLKVGGIMPGMSRDKCGAAAVAGLVLTAAVTKPAVRIIAELGFVRNSIGADSFVADEIITSHAGVRVLIGNTDAEGRLVLSDCLSHLREKVIKEDIKNPRFFSIATLTGHVMRAYGSPYTGAVENGPARSLGLSHTLQKLGQVWGEPLEVSTIRKEDVAFTQPKNNTYDLLQANTLHSNVTPRGHQYPAIVIQKASGLFEHGKASKKPYPYTHLDIAGSAMSDIDYIFGKPTGTPIVALAAQYIVPRLPVAAKFALKL